jgi:hypothetical protein
MASTTSESTNEGRFGVAVSTGFRLSNPTTGRTMEFFLCPEGDGTHGPDQALGFFGPAGGTAVRCDYCAKRHPIVSFEDASRRSYIVAANTGSNNLDGICVSANQIADAIYEAGVPRKTARPQAVRARA